MKGGGINPDLLGSEEGLAGFEPPPPMLKEELGIVTNKLDGKWRGSDIAIKKK